MLPKTLRTNENSVEAYTAPTPTPQGQVTKLPVIMFLAYTAPTPAPQGQVTKLPVIMFLLPSLAQGLDPPL